MTELQNSFLVLVKGDRQKGSQVNPTATQISALAKGNRQMGFQVGQAANINFFWLKEIARRDLRMEFQERVESDRRRGKQKQENRRQYRTGGKDWK